MTNITVRRLREINPNFDFSTLPKLDNLHYPNAINWMWNYCVYLGSDIVDGEQIDIGFWLSDDDRISAAIVYGENGGNYYSGMSTTIPAYIRLNEMLSKFLFNSLTFSNNKYSRRYAKITQ